MNQLSMNPHPMTKNLRKALWGLVATGGLMLGAAVLSPAAAQQQDWRVGPWCFESHENLTPDCSQPNLEQCKLTSLNGRSGRCYRNPNYRGPAKKQLQRY